MIARARTSFAIAFCMFAWAAEASAGDDERAVLGIEELRSALASRPDDLDRRLALAHALSRSGENTEAREQALEVIAKAPEYWDAHLLVARIDAWGGRYAEARERLKAVLGRDPKNRAARIELAEVELWSGALDEAKVALLGLLASGPTADLYYRLAQLEYERLHYWAAWEAADEALAIDPTFAKARSLRDDVRLVSSDFALSLELLPRNEGGELGHGEILSVCVLPRSVLSARFTEEYRNRFGTDNNRLTLEVDWRITKTLSVAAAGGFGRPASLIPEATLSLRFVAELLPTFDAALGYTYDRLPLDAALHRGRFDAGLRIADLVRVEAAYVLGFFDDLNAGVEVTHGAQIRACFEPTVVRSCASYGFGTEFDPALLFDPLNPLARIFTHVVGLDGWFAVMRGLDLGGALELLFRSSGTRIYALTLGGRLWL